MVGTATMNLEPKDLVWNRACEHGGGANLRVGDRSLADALKVHGLVMNGGVHHAVEVVGEAEVRAAALGFEYFGFQAIGDLLVAVLHDPTLREWNDGTEEEANRRYWEVLPDDNALVEQFELVFRTRPEDFAAIDLPPSSL
jgi:hypothetical protein